MTSFFKPATLPECLAFMREHAGVAPRPIAGGTDLMLELRDPSRRGRLGAIVDVWQLSELRGIVEANSGLRIGALATFADLIESPLVRREAPLLAAVSREIGGIQIQNRGTIGGNIGTGSPSGDSLPILLAYDAEIVLASTVGERRVPARDFYTGYRTSVRRPDELIAAVIVPRRPAARFSYYRKVATRRAQAISKVLVAMSGERRDDGAFDSIAIGLGAVAPTPVRAPHAEAFILEHGGRWTAAALDGLAAALAQDAHPIDDLRSTARYRSTVTFNLVRRALVEA